jgi:hypothetical protein
VGRPATWRAPDRFWFRFAQGGARPMHQAAKRAGAARLLAAPVRSVGLRLYGKIQALRDVAVGMPQGGLSR